MIISSSFICAYVEGCLYSSRDPRNSNHEYEMYDSNRCIERGDPADGGHGMNSKLKLGLGVLAMVFLVFGAGCIETVSEGHVGVKQSFGAATGEAVNPGLKIDRPGISYYDYDAREKLYVMSAQAGEGDNAARDDSIEVIAEDEMTVMVDAAVVWQIDRTKAVDIYTNVGPIEQAQERVRSKARECIRQAGS